MWCYRMALAFITTSRGPNKAIGLWHGARRGTISVKNTVHRSIATTDPARGASGAGCLLIGLLLMVKLSVAGAGNGYRIYVTNEFSGTLSVIDPRTEAVVATVALGKRPRGAAASPDGKWLYVALSGSPVAGPGVDESTLPPPDKSADGIGVVSLRTLKLLRTVRGVSDPERLAVSPDGKTLIIASEDTGSAVLQDAASGKVRANVPIGDQPEGVTVSPDGRSAWITAEGGGTVSVLDLNRHAVTHQIGVGSRPRNIVFSRDGRLAYVANEFGSSISVIDTTSFSVTKTIRLSGEGLRPMGLAVAGDDQSLYATTGHGGTVVRIDTGTLEPTGSVVVGDRPWGLALSPDGGFLYAANGLSNNVAVVATGTLTVRKRIEVGTRPWGVIAVPAP